MTSHRFNALRDQLRGDLLLPSDPRFEDARGVFSTMIEARVVAARAYEHARLRDRHVLGETDVD